MLVKVFDMHHKEQDLAWAVNKYGVRFRQASVEPGQKVYRLVELREKTGVHALVTQVVRADGTPMRGVDVAFYWVDAPDPPDPPTEVTPHDWYRKFVHGVTGPNGDVGPGMGKGAYHGEGEGGPHAVWVRDSTIPSDICEGLGMLAGTFHDHLDQKFMLVVAGGGPLPPGEDEFVLGLKEIVRQDHGASMLGIAYPASVALDTRGDGQGPGVDEDIHPVEWVHPDGTKMALVEMCTDFAGTGDRAYTLQVYRLSDKAYITEEVTESFPALGAPRERVVFVFGRSEGPVAPPPPEGDDLAALAQRVAAIEAKLRAMKEVL